MRVIRCTATRYVRDVSISSPIISTNDILHEGTLLIIRGSVLKTPMTEEIYKDVATREGINAMTPWGEWGLVEDVAKCAVFLASEDANYVTGLPMVIDGGYTAQ